MIKNPKNFVIIFLSFFKDDPIYFTNINSEDMDLNKSYSLNPFQMQHSAHVYLFWQKINAVFSVKKPRINGIFTILNKYLKNGIKDSKQ